LGEQGLLGGPVREQSVSGVAQFLADLDAAEEFIAFL
jgi:hypothetical protein